MAALKELKSRIATVRNTLKITSAMKMIATAKFHRVQSSMLAVSEYWDALSGTAAALCGTGGDGPAVPLASGHKGRKKALLVAISSDTSLCGSFNANLLKKLAEEADSMAREGYSQVTVLPIGEKAVKAVQKAGWACNLDYRALSGGPLSFSSVCPLADFLMNSYIREETDNVCMVYSHFYSMGRQLPVAEQLLPLGYGNSGPASTGLQGADYIVEPRSGELLASILPAAVRTALYKALLDSVTAENAARMLAMQTASDNAEDLLDELSLEYNKTRQQAITDELADIVSGMS